MILTTTHEIPGGLAKIVGIQGPVGAEVVLGIHLGKDLLAGLSNVFGGRSGTYEKELQEAHEEAQRELKARAEALGANAVVGIQYDYTSFGADNGMVCLVMNGTAVTVE